MRLKNIGKSVASTILCTLYLLSVTGFDIHTDGHDGKTYVVSLINGISCNDIHPEDDCACCHHHHDENCDGLHCSEEDCSNSIHILDISGTDDSSQNHYVSDVSTLYITAVPYALFSFQNKSLQPGRVLSAPPRERLRKISILRV